jgi:hypothetical protein
MHGSQPEHSSRSAATDLDNRIAAAFSPGLKSADVAALIIEVEAAAISAHEAADRARARALDPVLSSGAVTEARRDLDHAAFRCERLQIAISKLKERLEEVKAQEEDDRRRVAYEKARAERDQLAAELADIYPTIADKLPKLLGRIAANDRMIEYINNHALPREAARLLVAELAARGIGGFMIKGASVPRITEELRLPAFEHDVHHGYAWPPRA